ncbi:hypothetical protein [Streptomyces alboflavus]|uniref:hypothetical protein n=1 Tax=Streptomyces alboflavus TaxID=67267 RepID=UPI00367D0D4A
MHLLVVDWDFFFPTPAAGAPLGDHPELYAWPVAEDADHVDVIWLQRLRDFQKAGVELPRCHGYQDFWSRFRIAPEAPVWYADSNAWASQVFPSNLGGDGPWDSIHLYDAHHDCGYKLNDSTFDEWKAKATSGKARISAENWMLVHYWNRSLLFVHFPPWRESMTRPSEQPLILVRMTIDEGDAPDVTFDAVFLCRSGAWVPSWCDDQFETFLKGCPARPVEHPRNVWRQPRADVERMESLSQRIRRSG